MIRTMTTVATVLFAATATFAGYQLRLETSDGADQASLPYSANPQSLALNIVLSSDGQPDEFGSTHYLGAVLRLAPSAPLALSGLSLNTVDFDAQITTPNTTDPLQLFGIAADGAALGPYTARHILATVMVTLPAFTAIPREGLPVQPADVSVVNDQFSELPIAAPSFVITPEPAAALLLAAGIPLLARRRRTVAKA